jgi:PPOX class probable F420-dependent enzyme
MQLSAHMRAFLEEPRFAVTATINPDGTPQQTVLWYELQGDELMMNTANGRIKVRNLQRDPRMSFCIEDGYRYLTLTGTVTLIFDPVVAQADIAALARRYREPEQAESMIAQFRQQERVTLRMAINAVVANGFDQ